jgi:hypothetical protein
MAIIYATTGAVPNTSLTDGQSNTVLGGKAGELIVAELHGFWYTAAYRGRSFHGSAAIAGVTIPRETTTAATFLLNNPSASGVNLELISFDLANFATTDVVANLLLAGGVQTPTAVTAITATVTPTLLGGGAVNKAVLASVATVVAMSLFWPLFQKTTTTAGTNQVIPYVFSGRLLLSPGSCIQLCSNPIQAQAQTPAFDWAEWPI